MGQMSVNSNAANSCQSGRHLTSTIIRIMNAEARPSLTAELNKVNKDHEIIKRFWLSVPKKEPDQCWEWQGHKDRSNYGQIRINGRWARSHRLSFVINVGLLIEGMSICHSCDNPACVNPAHLWQGTNHENILDKVKKGRAKVGIGERQHLSKLTPALVSKIRELAGKVGHRQLAKMFNVARQSISCVINRRTWKHVP